MESVTRAVSAAAHAAVAALVGARGAAGLLDALPLPLTTAEALAVQHEVGVRLGATIGGWKCALPQGERIIAAPIFAALIHDAPGPVRVRTAHIRYEPELAFTLARDLPRGATRAEVAGAIGTTRLALELVHGRFRDPDAVEPNAALADTLYNDGLLLGPPVDAFAPITDIIIRDAAGTRTLPAAHPAGDPLAPLVWLASHGPQPLHAGMTIITGAFIAPQPVVASTTVEISFGPAGSLAAQFEFEDRP